MDAAPLECRPQHLGGGGLQPEMRVGDDQLDPTQTAARQGTQEIGPESLGFRQPKAQSQHFAPTVGVDANGQYGGQRDDPAILTHLHIRRVEPHEGPVALQRAVQEGVDSLIDLRAQAADLALGDAGHAHRLD